MLINKTVVSDKFENSDAGFKYFIGYKDDNSIRLLYFILPKMSGYIKYILIIVEKMSFVIEYDSVLVKYNEIWNKPKNILNIKFHSTPVFDEKYKNEAKEFNGVFNTNFGSDKVLKKVCTTLL